MTERAIGNINPLMAPTATNTFTGWPIHAKTAVEKMMNAEMKAR